jgi:hydrogenase maturation factor HypF (carbamoyltransferase family)
MNNPFGLTSRVMQAKDAKGIDSSPAYGMQYISRMDGFEETKKIIHHHSHFVVRCIGDPFQPALCVWGRRKRDSRKRNIQL